MRSALRQRLGADRVSVVLLLFVALWALAPLAVLALHTIRFGGRLTGADGLVPSDQLQYLAWVTDAASHLLAGNLFTLPPGSRVYAQPVFTLSGALRWVGLPLVAAYWVWKPVAVIVLFGGALAFSRRLLGGRTAELGAALALSLFLFTPLAAVAAWSAGAFGSAHGGLLAVAAELFAAGGLWGYLPTALAIGLTPVAVLCLERAVRSGSRRALVSAALCGAGAAWLHPWQGIVLALLLAGLAAWHGPTARRAVIGPLSATLLPLVYYLLLGRLDSSWRLAAGNELVPHPPVAAVLLAFLPLAPVAAAGARRPAGDFAEQALLVWLLAIAVSYVAFGTYPTHALEGASLPLSVLLVRGWRRLRWPAVAGFAAVALCTLPGMAYLAKSLRDAQRGPARQQFYLSSGEAAALDWVGRHAPPGGVLARTVFAVGIPAATDHPVWVGHQFWSRDYLRRSAAADALLDGRLASPAAQAVVRLSGVRLIVGDCGAADLRSRLRPVLGAVHQFGCATVYVVRGLR